MTTGDKTTLSMLKHNIRWWVICTSHILYTTHSSNCNSDTIYYFWYHLLSFCCGLFLHLEKACTLSSCSPTFILCWVPVATCGTTSGIEWSQIVHISANHPAWGIQQTDVEMISVPAADRDLVVRMRAIVPVPISRRTRAATPPHIAMQSSDHT